MMELKEFLETIDFLRKNSRGYCFNSYFGVLQWKALFQEGKLEIARRDGIAVAVVEDVNVYRILYFAESAERLRSLNMLLKETYDKPVVLGQLKKEGSNNREEICILNSGAKKIRELIRMKCQSLKRDSGVVLAQGEKIRLAEREDSFQILKILYDVFDIRVSHLPDTETVQRDISQQQIFLFQKEGKTDGFAYFQKIGNQREYLYQLAVLEQVRGQGIAYKLLDYAASMFGESCKYHVWVECDNMAAIHIYEKIGFTREPLKEIVYEF